MFGDKRRFPILVRDRVYEVLHPGEPIENVVRRPELHVFAANPVYRAVRTPDPRAHLRLLNLRGNAIAEGAGDELGQRLSLSGTTAGEIYAIEVLPLQPEAQPPVLALQWEQGPPARQSDNLVQNPDAEAGAEGWRPLGDIPAARALAYGADDSAPAATDPGPPERGAYLFTGGNDRRGSALRQEIAIDSSWRDAVARGAAIVDLSAYLGGRLREGDVATLTLTFVGSDQETLGRVALPVIGPKERSGQTGLWPAELQEAVPSGTVALLLDMEFMRVSGRSNDGYVDDVGVILVEP